MHLRFLARANRPLRAAHATVVIVTQTACLDDPAAIWFRTKSLHGIFDNSTLLRISCYISIG